MPFDQLELRKYDVYMFVKVEEWSLAGGGEGKG